MTQTHEVTEGDQVTVKDQKGAVWIVTDIVGDGPSERIHLVHVDFPECTRDVRRECVSLTHAPT